MAKEAIERAVKNVGGQRAMARLLGCTQQAVGNWIAKGRLPAERVVAVEVVSGVPRHQLRPDLFAPAPRNAEAQA